MQKPLKTAKYKYRGIGFHTIAKDRGAKKEIGLGQRVNHSIDWMSRLRGARPKWPSANQYPFGVQKQPSSLQIEHSLFLLEKAIKS